LDKNKTENLEPSFFELTVTMAFDYFRAMQVDVAVIEVGLGGRLDSTNIITPEVSVITNISFDHMSLLGNSLPEIAAEKAGIIKYRVPVVIGETSPETSLVFKQIAERMHASIEFADWKYHADYSMQKIDGKQSLNIWKSELLMYPNLQLDLLGIYQRNNVPTVLQTIDVLNERSWNLSEENVRRSLENCVRNTGLMGRWQIIGHNPLTICDTGHNPAGIKLVVEQIKQTPWKKLHIIVGLVNDKDQDEVLSLLPVYAHYYFTKASIPRATPPEELAVKAVKFGLHGNCYQTVQQAFSAAKVNAGENDLIFIGGSTFVVAEVL
jgi:dihydrofolate synthase/folylpolyglutamate synthase